MSNYIYAVADDAGNHLHTIVASSTKNAEEKIIENYREEFEIDEEFENYREFKRFMLDEYEYSFSSVRDIEAL